MAVVSLIRCEILSCQLLNKCVDLFTSKWILERTVLTLILLLCRILCRHFVAMETLMCCTLVSESMKWMGWEYSTKKASPPTDQNISTD